ncbi:hypothetical protein [Cellulomonas soli]|uniref:PBP domain-containing protein n=1 Tax=Cellulomonas soli TaxID=931535 RepID=A0A512P9C5_9CELL|nr:hypothetical protein [Cellulomonas soli]NYI60285.1 hypothetical protein [Cellulomonas soli]GEP67796.1 hypothetical protein CSO01_05110 [Cellulomonas soli]
MTSPTPLRGMHPARVVLARAIAATGLVLALVSATGLVLVATPGTARAAAGPDSSVTVGWADGSVRVGADATATAAEIAAANPDHAALTSDGEGKDAGSGHWDDFKDLTVTVLQTTGLIDQTVTVTASGMAATARQPGGGGSSNFLQVFQCWGDPAAADFAQTCQWGGYSSEEVGGTASSAINGTFSEPRGTGVVGRGGVTFRAVNGAENQREEVPLPGGAGAVIITTGLAAFYDSSSSNEMPFVPVAADGTAVANFTVQSAAAQPYLGCGDTDSAAGERCWLVVVPRGIHSGTRADGAHCGPDSIASGFGTTTEWGQAGSPLSTACSYWDDRVVLPLDFEDPYLSCPTGSAERRVVGSELVAEAVSSWQPSLCSGIDGATFSLTTNSGDLARAQLLAGQVDVVAVSDPLTADTIGAADPALLDEADIRYAPIANTALTIAMVAEQSDGTVRTDLRLTPRLLAKLLTQSYRSDVPQVSGDWGSTTVGESLQFLADDTVLEDEEWIALGNPTSLPGSVARAAWVVVGPQGDDAIRLLWQYVLADADAVAFLKGEPDPWGSTVNRYYLPAGSALAAGGGYDLLATALDTFPKADQSVAPDAATAEKKYRGLTIDSTSYSPYSNSLAANAARIARVDAKLTFTWDPNKFSGTNVGFFVASPPALPTNGSGRLIVGPTTAVAAESYGLATASLALPLGSRTSKETVATAREFVGYSDATVATAIAAQQLDEASGIAVTDMSALPSGAYPLATTVYAAMDVSATGMAAEARGDYAGLLDYAAGAGNVRTGSRGGLPEGYVPLGAAQVAAAHALATLLRTPVTTGAQGTPTGGTNAGTTASTTVTVPSGTSAAPVASEEDLAGAAPTTTIGITSAEVAAADTTEAAASPARTALGVSLATGLAGMVAAPLLLRRKPGEA